MLTGAFFHAGTYSSFRRRHHGRPVDRVNTAGHRFVVCLQNHDQIGNRALGDRLALSPGLRKVGAALILASPFTPMLFMGEEWGATTPWLFFTSHPEPELARRPRARAARRSSPSTDGARRMCPTRRIRSTFARSKLDWSEPDKPEHRDLLDFYRALIALRRSHPDLVDPRLDRVEVRYDEDARWLTIRRGTCTVAANLAPAPGQIPVAGAAVLLSSDPDGRVRDGRIELAGEAVAILTG